jgi:flagellar basal body-associated protein FliL
MKIASNKKTRNNKKIALISVALFVLLIAGVSVAYAHLNSQKSDTKNNGDTTNVNKPKTDLNAPTDEQTADGNSTKENTIDPDKTPNNNDSANGSAVTISFTAKNQLKDTNQNVLQLRTQITSVDNSGTCTLEISDGKNTLTRTARTQALASSSTCEGFNIDVPTSGLKNGLWSLKVTYASGTTSETVTDSVTIK